MKVSEKSLELNVAAELLSAIRQSWRLPGAYLRGLTQAEEKAEGVDFFLQLNPASTIFAFQFKAPLGRDEQMPYRFTLGVEQHAALHSLAVKNPDSVYYVLPFYVTPAKLSREVPNLSADTWLLPVDTMDTNGVFGAQKTKRIRCTRGIASVNPDFEMTSLATATSLDLENPPKGVGVEEFAAWYADFLSVGVRRRNPWTVRGLRIAIVEPVRYEALTST